MKRSLIVLGLLSGTALAASRQTAGYPDFELVESIPVETSLDNPDVRNTQEVWLEMINGAAKTLHIEEFYISDKPGEPLEDIIRAVTEASERGVAVRIVIDSRMYKTYPETADLLRKQRNTEVRVIDYGKVAGGVQHSKYFIVDGSDMFLGSQNFDWRSLKHIRELGVRIRDPAAVRVYEDIFAIDWALAGSNRSAGRNGDPAPDPAVRQSRYETPFRLAESNGDTIDITPTGSPKGLIPDSTLWDEKQIVGLIDGASRDILCQFLTYYPVSRDKSYHARRHGDN